MTAPIPFPMPALNTVLHYTPTIENGDGKFSVWIIQADGSFYALEGVGWGVVVTNVADATAIAPGTWTSDVEPFVVNPANGRPTPAGVMIIDNPGATWSLYPPGALKLPTSQVTVLD